MDFCDEDDETIGHALRDVNCDEETIMQFLQLRAEKKWEEAAKVLAKHRCQLVCAMHEAQKPIDILDYLLHQLKNK